MMTATKHLCALALSLGLVASAEAAATAAADDAHAAHHPQPAMSAADDMDMDMEPGDMSSMDHGQTMQHDSMDHGQTMQHDGMDHGPTTQHNGMDHSQATQHQGMDHSPAMQHDGMSHEQTMPMHQQPMDMPVDGYGPVPALTDADRAAAFPRLPPHAMHDGGINGFFLADRLEWQDADAGSALAWDITGWIGGDIDRLQVRSEGERLNGRTEDAELQLLWGHAIGPWWETVAGVRQDFKPGAPQTWAAFGVQGTPLFGLETEATAFLGEGGQTAARLAAEYDLLITNRLILQPRAEANLYGRNDPQRGIGAGLGDTQFGLRLRYEIRREFAPYIGVNWSHAYGNSAAALRDSGEDASEARLVAGIRLWF